LRGGAAVPVSAAATAPAAPPVADAPLAPPGKSRPPAGSVALRRGGWLPSPEQLQRMGRLVLAMAETSPDALIVTDSHGRITHWSRGAERIFGFKARAVVGGPLDIIVPPELRGAHEAGMARLAQGGQSRLEGRIVQMPALHADGSMLTVELTVTVAPDPADGICAVVRDITARKALEAEKARNDALLATLFEAMPAFLFVKDARTLEYRLMNAAGERLTGRRREDVIGRTDQDLMSPTAARIIEERDRAAIAAGGVTVVEVSLMGEDGQKPCALRTTRVVVPGPDGTPELLVGITEDVTELRAAEQRSRYLETHDPLTGLPNRARLIEHMAGLLDQGRPFALFIVDLDRFKAVNEFFGHAMGDRLLKAAGVELAAVSGENDFVARLGADEFAIVHPDAAPGSTDRLARMVVAALRRPFLPEVQAVNVGASLGVAVAPGDGQAPAELLRNADLALQRARAAGRGTYCYFEAEMDRAQRERRELEAALRTAVVAGQIVPHFQPIVDIASAQVTGFEALARWFHPTRGFIRPDIFIGIAEEAGLIVELGRVMLNAVVGEAARWSRSLGVTVNVSPAQLAHAGFVAEIRALLARTGIDPRRVGLEVTENLLIRDADEALATLRQLKALGLNIIMDDFGSGYSSLRYFQLFPFDTIKIDRAFVADMDRNAQSMAVVQAAVGLGRGLSAMVVAEGVETPRQLEHLRALGCSHAQGYLFGKPASIETFADLVGLAGPEPAVPDAATGPGRAAA
jgi:diguanylate cyclase (GGDEF)-like protein/PAS domain S-box-containing protein